MTLTVGSLFSGIGGIDLGLERAGMTVKWHSEIDPYASQVLKKHWPHVPNIGDITAVNWEETERVDVIAGGYPCQPFSLAGRRNGENDPQHLWPYFRNAISVLRPRYALLENVRGHLSMGGLSVIGDLTALGYDAEWRIISAASVGANHQRDRLIVVAYPNGKSKSDDSEFAWSRLGLVADSDNARGGISERSMERKREAHSGERQQSQHESGRRGENVADTSGEGLQGGIRQVFENGNSRRFTGGCECWWKIEPDVGRVANGIPARVDRLRALGNAVVPQVAEVVGRLIMEHARRD